MIQPSNGICITGDIGRLIFAVVEPVPSSMDLT
jgi:hypothetical protein